MNGILYKMNTDYITTQLDMMKKIEYYRSIQDDEKVKEWLHKLNCNSEEEWYEKASPEIKSLLYKGVIQVFYSHKVKQLVEQYKKYML
jgi:hypothetical protein